MDTSTTVWHFPTEILFGCQTLNQLSEVCQQIGFTTPLLVIDPFLLQQDAIITQLEVLKQKQVECVVFSDIKSNPSDTQVIAACQLYKQHQLDGVIAIGGGSALDLAKTVALLGMQELPLWELEDVGDNYLKADATKIARIIAIPTTAGTGSEVGRAAVIHDTQEKRKKLIFHPQMLPTRVIADPTLTASLPPKLTAATGMDALAHNLEAFLAPSYHPMADGIALEGMRLVKENLPIAYQDGQNLLARGHMLSASMMGACAFQKGLGVIHSLSHPIGALYDAHHGLLNALLMPHALRFNRDYIQDKSIRLASYLGLKPNFDALYEWVIDLCKALNLPLSLKAIAIDDTLFDTIIADALVDPSTPSNPRPLTPDNLNALLHEALNGSL